MARRSEREFLSCDWGTSYFRLKWVIEGQVTVEMRDENGCKKLHQAASHTRVDRRQLYEDHLQAAVSELLAEAAPAGPVPLLVSGMASSTIGWLNVPYARAPLALDGSGLTTEKVEWKSPKSVGPTYLVSGIATETNMMRGEETEAIGLFDSLADLPPDSILLLPGTHSKHLRVRQSLLTEINTYMTGELYSVLSEHSVLAASVERNEPFKPDAFRNGLDAVRQHGLAAGLFLTRTRQVLEQRSHSENASFLSGILIGAELQDLLDGEHNILVGGSPSLRELYSAALTHYGIEPCHVFSDEECENAVVRAHTLILRQLES